MTPMPQDLHWYSAFSQAQADMRLERHFGTEMRCFARRPANIDDFFTATVAQHGEREAVVDGERRLSFSQLDRKVDNLAAGLAAHGIGVGERVVLLLGNRAEFLALVLACARIGAVAVPMGIRHARDEVRHVVNDCAAVALVFESSLDAVVPSPAETPTIRLLACAGDRLPNVMHVDDLASFGGPAPRAAVAEEETAVLLYTSGTTGHPKGAMLTHLGIVHSVMHFARCYELNENDRTLLAVPCSHVTGLVSLLLTATFVGSCSVLMSAFKARDFLAIAQQEAITYTLMVPAMYLLCLREETVDRHDLPAWRVGGFGGTPMPETAIEALARRWPRLRLQQGYGATETTSPTSLMPAAAAATHMDSVGQVVPCGHVRVVDSEGNEVPPGTAGEVWVGGPMVVRGYWNNPTANEHSFLDGFWKSGDVGSIDESGFLKIFDRLKDMINRGGYKIFSAEVENALAQHPEVIESAVFGHPDPVLFERVRAIVVIRSEATDAQALREFCASRLADYKVPEIIELRTELLPRNANGKIRKNLLRQPHPQTL